MDAFECVIGTSHHNQPSLLGPHPSGMHGQRASDDGLIDISSPIALSAPLKPSLTT